MPLTYFADLNIELFSRLYTILESFIAYYQLLKGAGWALDHLNFAGTTVNETMESIKMESFTGVKVLKMVFVGCSSNCAFKAVINCMIDV